MTSTPSDSEPSQRSFVADSLATGMLVMLAMTILQRGLGFCRGIWFCRVLDDAVVGQWSMAHDFICMITPMMLLGMPGSMPRYVEHYRIRGHLSSFVRRVLLITALLGFGAYAIMCLTPGWFGWLVFLDPTRNSLIHALAAAVLATIGFYFVQELVRGLRQVRIASLMQFTQSVGFTVIAISWLCIDGALEGVVYAFAIATALAIVPGALTLSAGWAGLDQSAESFDSRSMWRRVLPFAMSVWSMNLLANAFGLSDRYMILHLLPGDVDAQAAVGQYHSARIFPILLVNLAAMVSGVLLPYLSADWEAGRRMEVIRRLKQMMFGIAAAFTVGAAVVLLLAPWIFGELLQGRYSQGLALMPMAFVFSIWVALASIGENYLWVTERGKLAAAAMGLGLTVNISLNVVLLPIWGLHGAVTATLIANLAMLLGTWAGMARHGYRLDQNTIYATILPATLLAGPWTALLCVTVVCLGYQTSHQWLREAVDRCPKPVASG